MTTDLRDKIQQPLAAAYTVEREIGRGGMAAVFLAQDHKHQRPVALKVLLPELSSPNAGERFLREIHLAARLTHPHILPVLDSGDAGGIPYYAMPFIDGETLRDRLKREGTLTLDEATRIAYEVADALDYAHAVGVVHRDVKPENILLSGRHAIVADFGVAKAMEVAAGTNLTQAGMMVGTPAYMAPEQAFTDDQVDGRADLYALGCVAYEMLSGKTPFNGPTPMAVLSAHLADPPPPIESPRGHVPPAIDAAIMRALAKQREQRFASAGDFARAITGTSSFSAPVTITMTGDGGPRRSRILSSLPGMAVLTPRATQTIPAHPSQAGLPSIAVLPFVNMSADPENEYFSDGMTEEIITALSRLRTIHVAARTSAFAFKEKKEDVRAIGEKLNVATVLEGSVRKAGTRIRVSAQLNDVRDGFQLWSEQYDRQLDDVFAIQDEIARAIVDTLKVQLLHSVGRSYVTVATETPEAYELYLRGRFAWNKRTKESLEDGLRYFEQAIDLDENYAPAHVGLADSLTVLGLYGMLPPHAVMPLAREAAERALALDPTLGEAHTALACVRAVYDWDWQGAEEQFRRAIAINPRYSTAHHWYAINCLTPQGRFEQGLAELRTAQALDPLSPTVGVSTALHHYFAGEYMQAIAGFQQVIRADPTFGMAFYFLGQSYSAIGDFGAALAALERAVELTGGTTEITAEIADVHARDGRKDEARRLLDDLLANAHRSYVSPTIIAMVHVALGDEERALSWLERAVQERAADLVWLGVRPSFAALTQTERGRAILREIGLATPQD